MGLVWIHSPTLNQVRSFFNMRENIIFHSWNSKCFLLLLLCLLSFFCLFLCPQLFLRSLTELTWTFRFCPSWLQSIFQLFESSNIADRGYASVWRSPFMKKNSTAVILFSKDSCVLLPKIVMLFILDSELHLALFLV